MASFPYTIQISQQAFSDLEPCLNERRRRCEKYSLFTTLNSILLSERSKNQYKLTWRKEKRNIDSNIMKHSLSNYLKPDAKNIYWYAEC